MHLDPLYREIVETSADGIWIVGLDGRLVYANRAIAGLLGLEVHQLVGTELRTFLDEEGREQFDLHLTDVRRGIFHDSDVDVQLMRTDGAPVWVLTRETPLHGADGELMGVLHRMTDYSGRRRMLDEISLSQAQLAEAERMAGLGHITYDLVQDVATASEGYFRILGLPPGSRLGNGDETLSVIHGEDRAVVAQVLEQLRTTGRGATYTARVRSADGWTWVRVSAEATTDADGRVVGMRATVQDISEQIAAERALRHRIEQNTLMEAVASAANEASTLEEVLRHCRDLVLAHPQWVRARSYQRVGEELEPIELADDDWVEDVADPERARLDCDLAARAVRELAPVWNLQGTAMACPIVHDGEAQAAFLIASAAPVHQREILERQGQNVAIQLARVSEREAAARALGEARDQAMAASQQKSAFLAMVSHEIRTPLNGVIGLNELLTRTDLDPEQRRLVSGIELSGRALLALINDILDFSKIEAGALQLEQVDFDLRAVVEGVVAPMLTTARSKGLVMELVWDGVVPEVVNGDPTRLSQVLGNLLSNAVKFTSEGTVTLAVDVRSTADGWRFQVEVVDTGIGVSVDTETLFEPFRQADTSTTRKFGGTGLGLAICREIVTAFGGDIGVDSEPGRGSRFWFSVPLRRSQGGPVHGRDEQPEVVEVEPATPPDRQRVLVVEDNPVNQMVAVGLLESLGFDVETADDGLAALEVYDPARHQAVLMDLQMPRLDGLAATVQLRRRETGPRVPIIAMTATAVDGERERCLAAGMDDFLTKPVDPDALARTLAAWLDRPVPTRRRPVAAVPAPSVEEAAPVDPEPRRERDDLVDYERLDMLRDMDPDSTAYLDKAIGNFVSGADSWLDDIRGAIEARDVDRLRFAAHKLAGSAGNLGLLRADRGVRALELLADTGTTDGAADLMPEAEGAIAEGRELLLAYQASYARQQV